MQSRANPDAAGSGEASKTEKAVGCSVHGNSVHGRSSAFSAASCPENRRNSANKALTQSDEKSSKRNNRSQSVSLQNDIDKWMVENAASSSEGVQQAKHDAMAQLSWWERLIVSSIAIFKHEVGTSFPLHPAHPAHWVRVK